MKRVMFVCKKNSARSQMAEGFAKKLGDGKIEVTSFGIRSEYGTSRSDRNHERCWYRYYQPKRLKL